jgi:hypothetical protein
MGKCRRPVRGGRFGPLVSEDDDRLTAAPSKPPSNVFRSLTSRSNRSYQQWNTNEAPAQTTSCRGLQAYVDAGLAGRECPVYKSSKLDGSEDPWTTRAHNVLHDHVLLEVEAIDRMWLNVYVLHFQSV